MPDRRNGDMGTYKERLEELFNAKMSFFSLTDADKEKFIEWALQRHVRLRARDKKWLDKHPGSGRELPEAKDYFEAVYKALKKCNNKDYYTGYPLNWEISIEDDPEQDACPAKVRQERITFDHVHGRDLSKLEFVMCAGKTNDAKNDLSKEKFIDLCKTVLTHNGYTVSAPSGISGLSQKN